MPCSRRTALKGIAALGVVGVVAGGVGADPEVDVSRSNDWGDQDPPEAYEDFEVHRVEPDGTDEYPSVQAAVAAAEPRDLILLEPGVYREAIEVHDTPRLTIRGVDRNETIVDGEFERYVGIQIRSSNVVVENLTVRNCAGNGVNWTGGADGYRCSHVTAYNNRIYGIYAFDSRHGRFEHCLASGSDDAGFYIGQAQPADAVIADCVAQNNAMGYSGTNAGGNLVIRNSTFRDNLAGIVPNTLDSQRDPPQGHIAGGIRIENNDVFQNNNLNAPSRTTPYPTYGTGITIAGGTENDVVDNHVRDHAKFGIACIPMLDDEFYVPRNNAVMDNVVESSGRVDLALGAPASGNRFADNEAGSTRPMALERRAGSRGDPWVTLLALRDFAQTQYGRDYPRGATEDQPAPDDWPGMSDPEGEPPRRAIGGR